MEEEEKEEEGREKKMCGENMFVGLKGKKEGGKKFFQNFPLYMRARNTHVPPAPFYFLFHSCFCTFQTIFFFFLWGCFL